MMPALAWLQECLVSETGRKYLNDQMEGAKLSSALWRAYRNFQVRMRKLLPLARLLTDAQSQGTKVASTVARGRKTEGISRVFL
ncbi:hypothetical protein BJF92_07115 [Rhizobium rhizosphaerae]|uniref:Uncharacterized protein n=2 Tax=Xaviernesmea rhizosphaerae TaxID=1672749 RepID=A0A1Q9AQV9_9HYPH|nr:hypothetical protein BJF92_07115 [Xaviernesmea rhizosphaerae]